MIIIRIVMGAVKLLLILGIIELMVPGLSYDVSKQLVLSALGGGK